MSTNSPTIIPAPEPTPALFTDSTELLCVRTELRAGQLVKARPSGTSDSDDDGCGF